LLFHRDGPERTCEPETKRTSSSGDLS
jgi:hypothetical protein